MNSEDNVSVGKSNIHRTGVFANRDFVKGDVILEIDDSDIFQTDANSCQSRKFTLMFSSIKIEMKSSRS